MKVGPLYLVSDRCVHNHSSSTSSRLYSLHHLNILQHIFRRRPGEFAGTDQV